MFQVGLVTTNDPLSIRKTKSLFNRSNIPSDSVARRRVAPEDVLFRRQKAPTRYAENDIYWANERELPDGGRGAIKPVLPDSDLLKSIHGYTCRFYEAMDWRIVANNKKSKPTGEALAAGDDRATTRRLMDHKSMDETALLAFGILLEEAGRGALGETGDLAFVEGEGQDGRRNDPPLGTSMSEDHVILKARQHEGEEDMQAETEWERSPKRRRKA